MAVDTTVNTLTRDISVVRFLSLHGHEVDSTCAVYRQPEDRSGCTVRKYIHRDGFPIIVKSAARCTDAERTLKKEARMLRLLGSEDTASNRTLFQVTWPRVLEEYSTETEHIVLLSYFASEPLLHRARNSQFRFQTYRSVISTLQNYQSAVPLPDTTEYANGGFLIADAYFHIQRVKKSLSALKNLAPDVKK